MTWAAIDVALGVLVLLVLIALAIRLYRHVRALLRATSENSRRLANRPQLPTRR